MSPEPVLQGVFLNDLGLLTLRGHVAYAVRCARRVLPLIRVPEDYPGREDGLATLARAGRLADDFARGKDVSPEEVGPVASDASRFADGLSDEHGYAAFAVAHAARCAWQAGLAEQTGEGNYFLEVIASAFAAGRVLQSSCDAFDAEPVVAALRADFEKLRGLKLGAAGEIGAPVDPSEEGPLGSLWPEGRPA